MDGIIKFSHRMGWHLDSTGKTADSGPASPLQTRILEITMTTSLRIFMIAALFGVFGLTSACGGGVPPAAATLFLYSPTITFPVQPSNTPALSPTQDLLPITDIVIDGKGDDWIGRNVLNADPIGDSLEGYLDVAEGFAFVNRDAVYLMLELVDTAAPFVLFDMSFEGDGKPFQITWQPGQTSMVVVDWSSGTGKRIGRTRNTQVVYADVLEVRIDLDDLQNPGRIGWINVQVMADVPGRGWTAVDAWNPASTPVVKEMDSKRTSSNEEPYFYARFWDLAEGHVGEALVEPPIANNAYLTHSEDGTIYFQSFGAKPQVFLLDPLNRTVRRILELPIHVGLGMIAGGPGSSAYLSVENEVWQVNPDGSYVVVGDLESGFIRYFSPDGRFLAVTHDRTTLMEWKPDGTVRNIAGGFARLFDVVSRLDGTIFIYDAIPGDVVRINPDGSRKTLVRNAAPGEYANLGFDWNGNLYASFGYRRFVRIDMETGEQTALPFVSSPCAWNPNGFTITAEGKVFLSGDQVVWADLKTEESGILILNPAVTFAADIGPDDALYFGAPGCGNEIPAQVIRLADDGSQTVYLDGLRDTIDDLAFTKDGGLYIATKDGGGNHLFYHSPSAEGLVEIPGAPQTERLFLAIHPVTQTVFVSRYNGEPILEFDRQGLLAEHPFPFKNAVREVKLDFTADGTLYAFCSAPTDWQAGYTDRWILRLDLEIQSSEIVASVPRKEHGGTISAFDVDPEGTIWLYTSPDADLYRVTPQGGMERFARNLPIDAPALAVDRRGDIYFTCASGVFRIYSES